MNSVIGARSGGIDENVVLGESFDVFFKLRQLGLAAFLLLPQADGVHLLHVGDLLVLLVHDLPFLLQSSNEFLALIFRE